MTNLEVILSMEKLGNATVQQAQRMAQALKLPANAIAAISSGSLASQSAISGFSGQYGLNPGGQYKTRSQAMAPFLSAKNALNPTSLAGTKNVPQVGSNSGGVVNNFNNNINQNGFTAGDDMMMKKAAELITAQQKKNQRMGGGDLIQ